MQLIVKGQQIDVGDALREHVRESLESVFGKYFGGAIEATVIFSRDAHLLRAAHDSLEVRLPDPENPAAGGGFTVLGMGKLGARELNYSSDIDLVLMFDPVAPIYTERTADHARGRPCDRGGKHGDTDEEANRASADELDRRLGQADGQQGDADDGEPRAPGDQAPQGTVLVSNTPQQVAGQ